MRIGLVGNGFVGNAIYENLKQKHNFYIFDKNPERANCDNLKKVVENCKIIFVALPTPMHGNGSCDLSIIFKVMEEINYFYNDNIIVLKSTVVPGTCDEIKSLYPNIRIVFSPEFLTEANYIEDFKNCNRMIFGGEEEDTAECVKLLMSVFQDKYYFTTDLRTAEMVKYFINNFLAVKVSFANEFKQICEAAAIDYEKVKNLALYDNRIADSHLRVPGPDGNCGFGGTCFPKDINAMIYFSSLKEVDSCILKSAWRKNLEVRDNKDWEIMFGRAVSVEGGKNEQ
mgnify:CR=1 FL=1|tara:strand:+ start:92 stop:943 length:852 start_codon:yes stop_codon:yes gene_type:complete